MRPLLASCVGLALISASACDDGGDSLAPLPTDPDLRAVTCEGAPVSLPAASATCAAPSSRSEAAESAAHVPEGTPIDYPSDPPLAGPHRGQWAKWGLYDYLPATRYLHNLEHGGVAILHDPCLDEAGRDALLAWARAQPADETGAFRWVMTPWPGLPTAAAVLAWGEGLFVECLDEDALGAFLDEHYRAAPEDLPFDGAYAAGWQSR